MFSSLAKKCVICEEVIDTVTDLQLDHIQWDEENRRIIFNKWYGIHLSCFDDASGIFFCSVQERRDCDYCFFCGDVRWFDRSNQSCIQVCQNSRVYARPCLSCWKKYAIPLE